MNPIWPKQFARIQLGCWDIFFAIMWCFGFSVAMEQKPWSWEVALPVRPPASRTCPLFGSCPGRRCRAVCSEGDPCPTGQTGAVHSGSCRCSLLWGNPATQDGQTHSLQHTEKKRLTMRRKGFFFFKFEISLIMYGSRRFAWASCKVERKSWKDKSIQLRYSLLVTPAEVNKLKATKPKVEVPQRANLPITLHLWTLSQHSNTNSTTRSTHCANKRPWLSNWMWKWIDPS